MQLSIVPDILATPASSAICVPISGSLRPDGSALIGDGLAFALYSMFPGVIDVQLGDEIRHNGLHVVSLGYYHIHDIPKQLLAFPYRREWDRPADIGLVMQSVLELGALTEDVEWWKRGHGTDEVLIPIQDLVCGGLAADDVDVLFSPIYDGRIVAVVSSLEDLL